MVRSFARLRRLVPASIAARGFVLLALAVASVVVPALWAYRTHAEQQRQRQAYERETFLGAALEAYLDYAQESVPERAEWLARVEKLGRRVYWAGVFDTKGDGVEFRRRTAIPRDQIIGQIDLQATRPTSKPLTIDGTRSRRFELLTLPHPESGTTLAVIVDRGIAPVAAPGAMYVWLALLSLAGLGLTWGWFHWAIARPVREIVRQVAAVHADLDAAALAGSLPAELVTLAQSVAQTREELERWRVEATYLRRSADATVDARTRRAERAQRVAEREAETDALTRLANRRVLERELPRLFAENRHAGMDLAVVVLDIDRFKQVNDTCGHRTGDDLLTFAGELIRAATRKGTDLAVRYGGDEFVLVLPGVAAPEAAAVARRIAALFAQHARTLDLAEPPALSGGIATMRQEAPASWRELLQAADQAMYWAKSRQRGVATTREVGASER